MKKIIALLSVVMAASGAMAQVWSQPWTMPLPAWQSTVRSCPVPRPMPRIALDDFRIPSVAPVAGIVYWGTVTNMAQLGRPMYYAVYRDNGNCQPNLNALVWRDCLQPQWAFVGVDCQGMRVFQFRQPLNPLNLLFHNGQKLWLQISEDDSMSSVIGVSEFSWSSHQPVNLCPATQVDAFGLFLQPLVDPCNGAIDDLAFELY